MKIEITQENFVFKRIVKDFTIELDGKDEIIIEKSWLEENVGNVYDVDWKIISGNSIYNDLKDEEKDELDDFISDNLE